MAVWRRLAARDVIAADRRMLEIAAELVDRCYFREGHRQNLQDR